MAEARYGGVVKVVDAASGNHHAVDGHIGQRPARCVHISKDTIIRRYAPDSVKFDDAKPGTLEQIKAGDQLRARGTKSDDGKEMTAAEIVSGTFRSIAGTGGLNGCGQQHHHGDRSGEQAAGDAEGWSRLANAQAAGDVCAAYRDAPERWGCCRRKCGSECRCSETCGAATAGGRRAAPDVAELPVGDVPAARQIFSRC